MGRRNKKEEEILKVQCVICLMWAFFMDAEEKDDAPETENFKCKKCKNVEWMCDEIETMKKRLDEAERNLELLLKNDKPLYSRGDISTKENMTNVGVPEMFQEGMKDLEVKIRNLEKDRDLLDIGLTESLAKVGKVEQELACLVTEEITLREMVENLVTKKSSVGDNPENVTKKADISSNKSDEAITSEVLVIGDSNIKRLDTYVANIGKGKRDKVSLVSFSGGKITDVKERIGKIVTGMRGEKLRVYIHVGINDANRGSEEILNDLKDTVDQLKVLNRNLDIVICEIPVRTDKGGIICSRLIGVNGTLQRKAKEWGCNVIKINYILEDLHEWTYDGVHYNKVAAELVGGMICNDIINFLC